MNKRLSPSAVFLGVIAVCLALVAGAVSARAQATGDPAQLYLQAYLLMKDGAEQEDKQRFSTAFQKYAAASEIFDSIAAQHPKWNPHMVNYRRRSIRTSITLVQSKARSDQGITLQSPAHPAVPIARQELPAPLPPAPAPAASPGNDPLALPQHTGGNRPLTGQVAPSVVATIPSSPPGNQATASATPVHLSDYTIGSATSHIENKFREMRMRLDEVGSERDKLANELRYKEAQLQNTQAGLYEAQQRQKSLELALIRSQDGAGAPAGTPSGGVTGPDGERVSMLEAQLAAASRKTVELSEKLDRSRREIELLKEERGQLITERNQMAAIIGEINTNGSVNLERLVALNDSLRRQLEVAQAASSQNSGKAFTDEAQLNQLRQQVAAYRSELGNVQRENDTYRQEVASLNSRLEVVSTELAIASNSGASAQTVAENEMLRDIIFRQLRQQARRQQAKELVMEELARLEVDSTALVAQLESLSGSEARLTENELAAIKSPALQKERAGEARETLVAMNAGANGQAGATIPSPNSGGGPAETLSTVASPAPGSSGSDSRTAIAAKIKAASTAFQEGQFDAAEQLYEEIIELDHRNPYYLSSLGVVKTRQKKFADAETLFKKAIQFDPFHAQSHLMLGALHFQRTDYDAALAAITKAVELNPNSASAHQYLGLIASKKGWPDRAAEEFKRALEIDPTFAEAHFNLSILYISGDKPERDLAAKHYQEALTHGAKPDPAIEQFIKG